MDPKERGFLCLLFPLQYLFNNYQDQKFYCSLKFLKIIKIYCFTTIFKNFIVFYLSYLCWTYYCVKLSFESKTDRKFQYKLLEYSNILQCCVLSKMKVVKCDIKFSITIFILISLSCLNPAL